LLLPSIGHIYDYAPIYRKIICTNNIIAYIVNYMTILLNNEIFNSEEDAISCIIVNSEKILENGKHFIPNWDILSGKIE
jgi:hypothetical protein